MNRTLKAALAASLFFSAACFARADDAAAPDLIMPNVSQMKAQAAQGAAPAGQSASGKAASSAAGTGTAAQAPIKTYLTPKEFSGFQSWATSSTKGPMDSPYGFGHTINESQGFLRPTIVHAMIVSACGHDPAKGPFSITVEVHQQAPITHKPSSYYGFTIGCDASIQVPSIETNEVPVSNPEFQQDLARELSFWLNYSPKGNTIQKPQPNLPPGFPQ